ncbi:MAG TPA: UvrB/UvrC motif-containing protein [Candidatus Omnitrophota bacterium]|nr:UvrB/UvrC motif-containing protein [Candidatus Omnitrophota bacterium]
MQCNLCGTAEATIHLTEIVNNQILELHLCENCANEKDGGLKMQFSFNDLLTGLSDFSSLKTSEKKEIAKCSSCGLTYEEFSKTGRLGCADCYQSFGKILFPLIKRVQKGTQHVGKRPAAVQTSLGLQTDLRTLRDKLRKSILAEEFEEAARIRDQIKQVEAQVPKKNARKQDKGA